MNAFTVLFVVAMLAVIALFILQRHLGESARKLWREAGDKLMAASAKNVHAEMKIFHANRILSEAKSLHDAARALHDQNAKDVADAREELEKKFGPASMKQQQLMRMRLAVFLADIAEMKAKKTRGELIDRKLVDAAVTQFPQKLLERLENVRIGRIDGHHVYFSDGAKFQVIEEILRDFQIAFKFDGKQTNGQTKGANDGQPVSA